jgi:hypothetical protein
LTEPPGECAWPSINLRKAADLFGQELSDINDVPTMPELPCLVHVEKFYWDIYISISGQPMLWAVCQCSPHYEIKSLKEIKKIVKNTHHMYFPRCCMKKKFRGES